MNAEGQLTIDIYRCGKSVERAEIASSRPLSIADHFAGKTVAETLEVLPLIFNVCAAAQASTGAAACEKALGFAERGFDGRGIEGRDLLVLAETAREHLLRIALDWPGLLDEPQDRPVLRSIMGLPKGFETALEAEVSRSVALETVNQEVTALLVNFVFGEPLNEWLAREDRYEFEAWARLGKTMAARFIRHVMTSGWAESGWSTVGHLPDLDDATLIDKLTGPENDAFTARPTWQGDPCETSALTRRKDDPLIANLLAAYGAGLVTRFAARLMELARAPENMRRVVGKLDNPKSKISAPAGDQAGSGAAVAQKEAARGRLAHYVAIEDGTFVRYRILAPTEWNFHPDGPVAAGLRALRGTDDVALKTQARLLIDAIDPCVGYLLRVH